MYNMYVRMYACTHVCMYGAFEDNGTEIIKNVGKSESRVVSKLPIIFKRTRMCVCMCVCMYVRTYRKTVLEKACGAADETYLSLLRSYMKPQ